MTDNSPGPYFNASGRPRLPDMSGRTPTKWEARASALVSMSRPTLDRILSDSGDRGDVLSVASIGGVLGARKVADIIPVCQRKSITSANVEFEVNMTLSAINVIMTVKGIGAVGVDCEAMSGAAAAALTIYELCKDIDSSIRIEQVHLEEAVGGTFGTEFRDLTAPVPASVEESPLTRPRLQLLKPGDRLSPVRGRKVKRKVKTKSQVKKKPRKKATVKTKSKPKPKTKPKAKPKAKPKLQKPKLQKPKLKRKSPAKPKSKSKAKTKGRLKRS